MSECVHERVSHLFGFVAVVKMTVTLAPWRRQLAIVEFGVTHSVCVINLQTHRRLPLPSVSLIFGHSIFKRFNVCERIVDIPTLFLPVRRWFCCYSLRSFAKYYK